jgi:hypothetical protein
MKNELYEILELPSALGARYFEMSKSEAEEFFAWLQQNYLRRISELLKFVRQSGGFDLDFTPESLVPMGEWLVSNLRLRKNTAEEMEEYIGRAPSWLVDTLSENDLTLTEVSLSISFDLALYFSRVLMRMSPAISWEIHTKARKLDADLNQLIVNGGTDFHLNPVRSMKVLCFGLATGRKAPTDLVDFLHATFARLTQN